MTSRTVKKPSDVIKSRQEYLDNLALQIDINKGNEEANKIYKLTGQLPPSTEMKDTRSVTDILLDTEKLKINLIKDLEVVANPQFALEIVNRLIQSPLNVNGELLVYTAQRAPDIVANLKKLYKYGIKGDANDAEQFVSFMAKYYSDRNKDTSSTKSFMSRMGSSNTGSLAQRLSARHEQISRITAHVLATKNLIFTEVLGWLRLHEFYDEAKQMHDLINKITKKLVLIGKILPNDPAELSQYERMLIDKEGDATYDAEADRYHMYIDFINHNIPNLDLIELQLEQFTKALDILKILGKSTIDDVYFQAGRTQLIKVNTILLAILDQLNLDDGTLRNILDIFNRMMSDLHGFTAQPAHAENPAFIGSDYPPPPPAPPAGHPDPDYYDDGGDDDDDPYDYHGTQIIPQPRNPYLVDMQSTQRRYPITGNPGELAPYSQLHPTVVPGRRTLLPEGQRAFPQFHSLLNPGQPVPPIPDDVWRNYMLTDPYEDDPYMRGMVSTQRKKIGLPPSKKSLIPAPQQRVFPITDEYVPQVQQQFTKPSRDTKKPSASVPTATAPSLSQRGYIAPTLRRNPYELLRMGDRANIPSVDLQNPALGDEAMTTGQYRFLPKEPTLTHKRMSKRPVSSNEGYVPPPRTITSSQDFDSPMQYYGAKLDALKELYDRENMDSIIAPPDRLELTRLRGIIQRGFKSEDPRLLKTAYTSMKAIIKKYTSVTGHGFKDFVRKHISTPLYNVASRWIKNDWKKINSRGMHGNGLGGVVDTSQGIQPSPSYIRFGKYLINTKKLNNNIISLRRDKGSSIKTIPARMISPHLGSIMKKIIGGGMPSYDDLNKLTDDEKQYLHKVTQESDIFDKLSIPTPSKDKEEQDAHQFNVLKGEIMAGNNSKEVISKFKLLVLKLSKQGILPKNQVQEILEELLELGL